MSRARESVRGGLDLLCYLGVYQKRWKAVIWLVKALSSAYPYYSVAKKKLEKLRAPQWKYDSMDLETLVGAPLWADDIIKPLNGAKISLQSLMDENVVLADGREVDMDREVIGQLWQSVACMILQAADDPSGDSKSKIIMSHVFEILAHLHHIDAFPHSVYHYNPPTDPFVPHKPPTLAILSPQIMTILSDTAWRARDCQSPSERNWHEKSRSDVDNRRQSPTTDAGFRAPELGHGIWLDLILWSCIDGGWISEAEWIVAAIDSRKHDPNLRWSVIRWDSINLQVAPKMGWHARLSFEYQRLGVDQLGRGIQLPGEGGEALSINIPPRTLSYEVVRVLIDGLISNSSNIKKHEPSIRRTQQAIGMCKRLLETEGKTLNPQIIDSAILRLLVLEGPTISQTPELLEQALGLSFAEARGFLPSNWANAPADESMNVDSAIRLGLLHRMLYCFAKRGLLHGALRSFKILQDVVEKYSTQRLKDFVDGKWQPLHKGLESANKDPMTEPWESVVRMPFKFRIPGYALIAFLECLIRAELWDLGKWLFYSNDVDGPTIHPTLYRDPRFQPVFLRFATATSDAQLLAKVTETLRAPLSESMLRALLHCQVAVGNWDTVQDILIYFRDEPKMQWNASDAMSIAAKVLQTERSMPKSDGLRTEGLLLAFSTLQQLISGEFNSSRSWALYPDLTQIRLMTQIGRILQKIPGKLSTLKSQYFGRTGRISAPIDIPVEAFNILMRAIVDCRGSIAGKELWDKWCRYVGPPVKFHAEDHNLRRIEDIELERVVGPDLETLRIILKPVIRSNIKAEDIITHAKNSNENQIFKSTETEIHRSKSTTDFDIVAKVLGQTNFLSKSDREILEWAITMYGRLGVKEEDLRAEVTQQLLSWQ